jgi:hypothetical protein
MRIRADVKIAGLTILSQTPPGPPPVDGLSLLRVGPQGHLWLEDCSLMLAGDPKLDPRESRQEVRGPDGDPYEHEPQDERLAVGVRVDTEGSATIRGCVIADAAGQAVTIHPNGGHVVLERASASHLEQSTPMASQCVHSHVIRRHHDHRLWRRLLWPRCRAR